MDTPTIEELIRYFLYIEDRNLHGLTFTQKDDGWLLTVKTLNPRGRPEVAFVFASEPSECIEHVFLAISKTNVHLKWKPDTWFKG